MRLFDFWCESRHRSLRWQEKLLRKNNPSHAIWSFPVWFQSHLTKLINHLTSGLCFQNEKRRRQVIMAGLAVLILIITVFIIWIASWTSGLQTNAANYFYFLKIFLIPAMFNRCNVPLMSVAGGLYYKNRVHVTGLWSIVGRCGFPISQFNLVVLNLWIREVL